MTASLIRVCWQQRIELNCLSTVPIRNVRQSQQRSHIIPATPGTKRHVNNRQQSIPISLAPLKGCNPLFLCRNMILPVLSPSHSTSGLLFIVTFPARDIPICTADPPSPPNPPRECPGQLSRLLLMTRSLKKPDVRQ